MGHRGACSLVVAGYLVLALIYAWVVPPLEGFDARDHFKYTAYLRQVQELPRLDPALVDYSYELIVQPPFYYGLIALLTSSQPMDQALAYTHQAENPYHDKSLSLRQTITLPTMSPGVPAILWTARLVSLLGGLATVLGAYALVRTLLPGSPWLAVGTAALVGFNPQFLFTAVTITNDAWVPAVSVITLWLLARAVTLEHPQRRAWLLVGLCAGLAALTKYSCLLIAAPGLLLFWLHMRSAGWGPAVRALSWMVLGALITAGWWYLRNWLLYGSPLPLAQMAVALPTMQRATPLSLEQTLNLIPWLLNSYWGVFVSILAPSSYFATVNWLMWIAAAGLCLRVAWWLVAQARHSPFTIHHSPFTILFALAWFITIFAGVLHWTRTITFGEQGRLIHAAAPAFALLLISGWSAWLPARWRRAFLATLPLPLLGLALWPLPTLLNAYALPQPLDPPLRVDRPLQATFAAGMKLLGVDLPEGAALSPGEKLPLRLYFQTDAPIDQNYTLFLHLADANDNLLYQFDGVPFAGRHPTGQWQPGAIFADAHQLTAKAVSTDTLAVLSLGFYRYDDPDARQPVVAGNGVPLGDRLVIGPLRVTAAPFAPPPLRKTFVARWEDQIQLVRADVRPDSGAAPAKVDLEWQATAPIQTDYTIFVQLLDASGQVVAQVDQPPLAGRAPTSTWRTGEIFADPYQLPPVTNWRQLIVGLYDATGRRLRLQTPNSGQDFFVLLEARG
jgi:4-amino-4-deoxy-L-arabinose transferase-like glycosyltransferase